MISGVRGLFYVRAIALGWYFLSSVMWSFLPAAIGSSMDLWFRVSAVLWLMLDGAELAVAIPFSKGRQGTPAEATARALVMLLAVSLLMAVVQTLPELGGPALPHAIQQGWVLAERLIFVAAEVCLWLSLTRSLAQPSSLGPAFYSLLALSTLLSTLPFLLAHESYFQLLQHPFWRWGRVVLGVTLQALPLIVLKRLLDGDVLASTAQPQAPPVDSPGRDILIGAIGLGAGLLVTVLSYSMASSGGGGRYVVATGAIAYGLVRLVRGLVKLGG